MSSEVLEKIIELMTAAFGLVAALAWNAAIQALFIAVFGEAGDLVAKFFYAIVVTIIVVSVLSYNYLGRRLSLPVRRACH